MSSNGESTVSTNTSTSSMRGNVNRPREVADGRVTKRPGVAALLAFALMLVGVVGASTDRVLATSYSLTDSVRMRSQPSGGSPYNGVAASGSTINVNCQQWGEGQGPRGNRLWLNVNGAGRNGWWVNDTWTTSPHLAADTTNGIAGVPWCNVAPSSSGSAPLVWVGSPIAGSWDLPASRGGDGPTVHHWLANARDQGDFAVDLIAAADQQVKLYVAPQDGRTTITARVDQIGEACRGGGGGQFATIGFYAGSTRIGSATYAHLRLAVGEGQSISRWDGVIGYVGKNYPINRDCWTGPHVHFQLYSNRNYACFNKGYSLGYPLNRTNFLGFTGGNVANAPRRACA